METKKTFRAAGKLCLIIGATLTVQGLVCPPLFSQTGKASWYSTEACQFNPDPKCPTASGDSLYDLEKNKIHWGASNDFRLGTRVRVTNLENGKSDVITILDRGGFKRYGRIIDLCKSSFATISETQKGITRVKVEVIL